MKANYKVRLRVRRRASEYLPQAARRSTFSWDGETADYTRLRCDTDGCSFVWEWRVTVDGYDWCARCEYCSRVLAHECASTDGCANPRLPGGTFCAFHEETADRWQLAPESREGVLSRLAPSQDNAPTGAGHLWGFHVIDTTDRTHNERQRRFRQRNPESARKSQRGDNSAARERRHYEKHRERILAAKRAAYNARKCSQNVPRPESAPSEGGQTVAP